MALRLATFPARLWDASLSDLLNRVGRWWLAEFLALFPNRLAEWLVGHGQRSLILSTNQETVRMQLLTDGGRSLGSGRVNIVDYSPAAIDQFLGSHELDRTGVIIGLRLPLEKFFRRTLVLPIETSTSLDRVVVQDLVAKTPFRLQDIYQDYVGSRTTIEGKIVVSQSVIRREFVNDAILPLGLDVDSLTFIEAEPEANQRDPPILITLSSRQKDRTRWLRPTAWGLILSTVVLSFIAAGSQYWRRQAVLDELRTRVEAARPKAQQARSVIDRLQQQHVVISRLRARRGEPRLIDIWEDATQILPSHSWLTELRLFETPDKRERQVSLTGLSAAASALVGLVDQSALLSDASLTAPVTLDPIEGRERFALQATVKAPATLEKASR